MTTDKTTAILVPISAAVTTTVKDAILKTAKREERTPSFVTARILEAWASGRRLPYRKHKSA